MAATTIVGNRLASPLTLSQAITASGGLTIGAGQNLTMSAGSAQFLTVDGAVGAPAVAFNSQPNTGMYKSATSVISFSSNGSATCAMGSYVSALQSGFAAPDGSFSTPGIAFGSQISLGIYKLASSNMGFTGSTWTFLNDNATIQWERTSNGRIGRIGIDNTFGGLELHGGPNGAGESSNVAFHYTCDSPTTGATIGYMLANGQQQMVNGSAATPTYSFISSTNTGIYSGATNAINFSSNGTGIAIIGPAGLQLSTGQFLATDGTVSAPGFAIASETGLGIYKQSANVLAISSNNVETMTFKFNVNSSLVQFQVTDGTSSLPSIAFANQTNTGIYRAAGNNMGLVANGTVTATIVPNGIGLIDGTASLPAYTFQSETTLGLYRKTTSQIGVAVGGALRGVMSDSVFSGTKMGTTLAMNFAGSPLTATNTVNNTTYTFDSGSVMIFAVELANGDGALCYTNFLSSTVTILGSSGNIVNSSTPGANQLGIFKSASSHTTSLKTGSSASSIFGTFSVCLLGSGLSNLS